MVAPGTALAVACTTPVKYASSSNTLYLLTPQVFTLDAIKQYCAAAPLYPVSGSAGTWELDADLVVENGATLQLHGSAAPSPGDVDTLRIRSNADNGATDVQQIKADAGTIDVDSVHITSWDTAAQAPDTNPNLPSGAPSGSRGRAFIRALSYLDTAGNPQTSTMTIRRSRLEYLGYYAAESYGVVFKAEGCDHTAANFPVCARLHVVGEETDSEFDNDFMGTYTWGAYGITFARNSYDHNVMYGLDPHDVSTYLTIDSNHFDYNGDHGVICSQRCDHLMITNNESDHNGMVPWPGPVPSGDPKDAGQVHGIMIHRGVTNTVISGNYVHDEPNGAGIAVFDCVGDTVTNNTIVGAEYGLRLSVGTASTVISDNTVSDSGKYAVYMYKGSDTPSYSTPSGHPTGNHLSGDSYDGTGSNALKLSEADANSFTDETFTNTGGSVYVYASTGDTLTRVSFDAGQKLAVSGTSTEPGWLVVADPPATVQVSVDTKSSVDLTSSSAELFAVAKSTVATGVGTAGSDLHLTSAVLGTTGSVTVTPAAATVRLSAGTGSVLPSAGSGLPRTFQVTTTAAGVTLVMTVSGLNPSSAYAVARDGVPLGDFVADASGTISFSDTLPTTGPSTYTVTAA